VSVVCRNLEQLVDIVHRYSSPVDTGIVLVQSNDVTGSGGRTQSAATVDAVFFTRVHFDIFGLFFPRDFFGLDSATKLLTHVYGAENLTLRVDSTELSPQPSSSSSSSSSSPSSSSFSAQSLNSGRVDRANGSLDVKPQPTEVYRQQLAILRRFDLLFYTVASPGFVWGAYTAVDSLLV